MNVSGFIILCDSCITELRDRSIKRVFSKPYVDRKSQCLWCGKKESLNSAEIAVADPYRPADFRTALRPEGEPWYITGYLKNPSEKPTEEESWVNLNQEVS